LVEARGTTKGETGGETMSIETRIRYLLQAASRAEGDGDVRVARLFRSMAEDARPVEGSDAALDLGFIE
jgi:hypothetical protein